MYNLLGGSSELNSVFLAVLTIFVLSTFLIFTCIWFKKRVSKLCSDRSFKGLEENEESYFNEISISTVPRVSFPLQPQIHHQNTSNANNISYGDSINISYNNPVKFEPLPTITKRTINKVDNLFDQLRPRISRIGFTLPHGSEEIKSQINMIKNISDGSFPRSQLQYIKELGVNKLAKVLQGEAYNMQPGRKRSQVTVVMVNASTHPSHQLTILQEALPYRELKHANVLRFFRVCTDSEPFLAIYESLKMGDLKTYLRSHRSEMQAMLNQGVLLSMICDVTAGLQALHQINYVHRDLALRNCMLTNDMVVKIGDYGLAEQLYRDDYYYNSHDDELGIPIRWMAPESLSFSYSLSVNDITKEANIWTMGVVIWEMLRCGDVPYPDLSNDYVIRLVAMEKQVKPQRPLVVMHNIKYIYELMEMCWAYEMLDRPTIRELKIMLLHLASSKQTDDATFNERWIQLKPIISSKTETQKEGVEGSSEDKSGLLNGNYGSEFTEKRGSGDESGSNINTNNNNNNDNYASDSEPFDGNLHQSPVRNSTNNLSFADELKLHDFTSPASNHSIAIHRTNEYVNMTQRGFDVDPTPLQNPVGSLNNSSVDTSQLDNLDDSYATAYDDLSPISSTLDHNSLLKMQRYNDYLQTVTTSIDNDYESPKINSQND